MEHFLVSETETKTFRERTFPESDAIHRFPLLEHSPAQKTMESNPRTKTTANRSNKTFTMCVNVKDFLLLVGHILLAVFSSTFGGLIPKKKKSLKEEIVLITGAGNGLGKELALKFAREEAILVLWDIDEASVLKVASDIHAIGGSAYAYACDVSDISKVQEVGNRVLDEVGDVTVVVNNAGILQNVLFTDLDTNKIRKTIEVNLLAHFWINKLFLPNMIATGKGHIVAISSVAGLRGWLYLADYSASKFAVHGMMESMEEEIRILGLTDKIHFTTACPITINTGLNQNPTTRLPCVAPILNVSETAEVILNAVQRNERIITVPRSTLFPLLFVRLWPRKVAQLVFDFLNYNTIPNRMDQNNAASPESSNTVNIGLH